MYNTILNVEMINLEKIKSEKSQPPPPFKKTCPSTILPPPFLKFSSYPVPGDIIKIYFFKGGGVQTMCNHTETLLSRIKTPQT